MPLNTLRTVGARMFLNRYVEDFGEIVDVNIDAKTNCAALMVALKGETTPLRLEVDYRVEPSAFVTVYFRCEREWIGKVLNRYLGGQRFDIDNAIAQTVLGLLL